MFFFVTLTWHCSSVVVLGPVNYHGDLKIVLCWGFRRSQLPWRSWAGHLSYHHCSWAGFLRRLIMLSPVTSERERMALEIISWPVSTKEYCRTRGSNRRPSEYLANAHPTELPKRASCSVLRFYVHSKNLCYRIQVHVWYWSTIRFGSVVVRHARGSGWPFQGDTSVVVPYCYLFLLSVFILWFSYYVSDIFCKFR